MDRKGNESKKYYKMTSAYPYQFQPQPPPLPRTTGGKRGPSGPLMVSSSSEDEESDTNEGLRPALLQRNTVKTDLFPSPRNVQILPLAHLRSTGGVDRSVNQPQRPTPSPRRESSLEGGPETSAAETEVDTGLPSSPRAEENIPSPSNFAHEHDHNYDNVASPSSSTASGPIYVRPPGFKNHAQEVECMRSKLVRKKSRPPAVIGVKEELKHREQTPPKTKTRREPLPMKLRALPQSFWQQPNVAQQVSPATMYPLLPPLCNKDTEEDIAEVRPVTPPSESGVETKRVMPERKISVANTDLLFKLFENISDEKKTSSVHLKRGRPRRTPMKSCTKGLLLGNDPYLVDAIADSLFPQLSLESSRYGGSTSLQLVTLGTGDKTITLPSLTLEQNYPQMLSELVTHI